MVEYIYSFLFPFLLLLTAAQLAARLLRKSPAADWRFTLFSAIFSLLVVLLKVDGIPIGRLATGLSANASVPLIALLINCAWKNAGGRILLDRRAHTAAYIFGLCTGAVLYPMALGIGRFDPYVDGWHYSWVFVLLMAATVFLLIVRNRFGLVLMLCLIAYQLHLQESTNLWDYVIDPIYFLASIIYLASLLVYGVLRRYGPTRFAGALRPGNSDGRL